MEIFIKKKGCKCNSTVRQILDFSTCCSVGAVIVYVLSLMKAFPIAVVKYSNIELIKKSVYADEFIWLLVLLLIGWMIAFMLNIAACNANIKKMSLYLVINGVISFASLIILAIVTATKKYDLQFAGYLILALPILAFFLEFIAVSTPNKFNTDAEVSENKEV